MPLDTEKTRKLIERKFPSLAAYAEACGWKRPSSVTEILSGRQDPSVATVDRMAAALGTTAAKLLK